jgi:hypothetical protein
MSASNSSIRAASILYGLPGLGFGIGVPVTLAYLARHGELPMTPFGWRLMGGPFPQIGTDRLTPLGWALAIALVGTSALDVVTAIWLRQGRPAGARLGFVTTPFSFGLAAVFVLPLLIAAAPVRAVLLLAGTRGVRQRHAARQGRVTFVDAD